MIGNLIWIAVGAGYLAWSGLQSDWDGSEARRRAAARERSLEALTEMIEAHTDEDLEAEVQRRFFRASDEEYSAMWDEIEAYKRDGKGSLNPDEHVWGTGLWKYVGQSRPSRLEKNGKDNWLAYWKTVNLTMMMQGKYTRTFAKEKIRNARWGL